MQLTYGGAFSALFHPGKNIDFFHLPMIECHRCNQSEKTIPHLSMLLLRQLYITVICLSKAPAAVLSSVADATASPPSASLLRLASDALSCASHRQYITAEVISGEKRLRRIQSFREKNGSNRYQNRKERKETCKTASTGCIGK